MTVHLRRLNSDGIERFAAFLKSARAGGDHTPPMQLLNDPATSESVSPTIDIPEVGPATKREAADLLIARLKPLERKNLMKDRGLWSWLALRWFDSVCPVEEGRRRVRQEYHYIPDDNFQRKYRHFVRTPYQISQWAPDHNRLWLDLPVSTHGDLMEQTASRLFLVRVPAIRHAMDLLYVNPVTGQMKKGALGEARPGNIRKRLPIRVRQLSRTFDIYAVDGEGLIGLLGSEFQKWRDGEAR
jgi:hypothetical protein